MVLTPGAVINQAKFHVCAPRSFGGVKAHVRTNVQTKLYFNVRFSVIIMSTTPYDIYPGAVISRAQFEFCTSSGFEGVSVPRKNKNSLLYRIR